MGLTGKATFVRIEKQLPKKCSKMSALALQAGHLIRGLKEK
jgi:hypothetical protein